MGEFNERTDNPLHKQFGILSNTIYVLKKIKKYCWQTIPIAIIGIVCGSILTYFWGIAGKYIIDVVQSDMDMSDSLREFVKIILMVGIANAVITFGNTYSNSKTWYRFIYVRMQVITERVDRVLGMNYQMLERPDVLDVERRASQATGGNNNGIEGMMHLMVSLGKSLFTLIVTFIAVLVVDWRLVFAIIIISLFQYLYFRHIIKKDKKEVWDALSSVWRKTSYMERVTQNFMYAKDIRLFDMNNFLVKKQTEILKEKQKKMDYHQNMWLGYSFISGTAYFVISALIYGVLFFAVLENGMSVGSFTMFVALSSSFSGSFMQFMQGVGDYKRASLEVDDFRSLMELEFDEVSETIPIPEADDYQIEFHDVGYKYIKAENFALRHLNLTIHPGEKLAVVGLNGAGKTTMIKLLLRLYDPTEGYITLNGTDIRKFKREDYYKLFSPVFQNIEVFAFTVAENVSMKVPYETDYKKTEDVLCESGLEEKIKSLEKGLDTELLKIADEKGIDLSGGEKQKLALARALYKGAPIVVLDEPTSALDALAEKQLYERFDHMIGNKSAVYISHRLASTRFCDNIAMFKDGSMIESGSHDELMAKGGEYARMFAVQAQYYQEEKGGAK